MRKVILCLLFAIAMVFGFTGCKNDAPKEPEWHEGNWYEGTFYDVYVEDSEDDYHFEYYFSLQELNASGHVWNDISDLATECFMIDNPKFTKIIKREAYELESDELLATNNINLTVGSTVDELYYDEKIIKLENRGLCLKDHDYSMSLSRLSNSNVKQIWYFDDGTTLTFYGEFEL